MRKKIKKINWQVLIISFVLVFLVAFLGGLFTSGNVNTDWYEQIKPSITPPNYIFPVVWTILFILIALSLYFSWINAKNKIIKRKIAIVFGINLFLNALWSFLFFSMQKPLFAYFDIILLWGSIITMISVGYRADKKAAYLLIPYLLWVSFAGILNYLIAF